MTNISKAELAVAALRNGTVIDHIPSEVLFKAVKIIADGHGRLDLLDAKDFNSLEQHL